MNSREWLRKERTTEVTDFVKSSLDKGEKLQRKELIIALMVKYNISRKTALDYINVAFFKNGLT